MSNATSPTPHHCSQVLPKSKCSCYGRCGLWLPSSSLPFRRRPESRCIGQRWAVRPRAGSGGSMIPVLYFDLVQQELSALR
ncbi:hypothetical protein FIBSPDRAFT_490132 [Athelia psychrophila]|uniref:Uncharacterized protein n=1 Tax=Athelia psychrophila TaxID=1759441 RepID=A0A166KL99_9AGAM|nr:hypothetical protein FIBSPDRAFT_490132 [Fibularhizoctonia sp. CBS 109695]